MIGDFKGAVAPENSVSVELNGVRYKRQSRLRHLVDEALKKKEDEKKNKSLSNSSLKPILENVKNELDECETRPQQQVMRDDLSIGDSQDNNEPEMGKSQAQEEFVDSHVKSQVSEEENIAVEQPSVDQEESVDNNVKSQVSEKENTAAEQPPVDQEGNLAVAENESLDSAKPNDSLEYDVGSLDKQAQEKFESTLSDFQIEIRGILGIFESTNTLFQQQKSNISVKEISDRFRLLRERDELNYQALDKAYTSHKKVFDQRLAALHQGIELLELELEFLVQCEGDSSYISNLWHQWSLGDRFGLEYRLYELKSLLQQTKTDLDYEEYLLKRQNSSVKKQEVLPSSEKQELQSVAEPKPEASNLDPALSGDQSAQAAASSSEESAACSSSSSSPSSPESLAQPVEATLATPQQEIHDGGIINQVQEEPIKPSPLVQKAKEATTLIVILKEISTICNKVFGRFKFTSMDIPNLINKKNYNQLSYLNEKIEALEKGLSEFDEAIAKEKAPAESVEAGSVKFNLEKLKQMEQDRLIIAARLKQIKIRQTEIEKLLVKRQGLLKLDEVEANATGGLNSLDMLSPTVQKGIELNKLAVSLKENVALSKAWIKEVPFQKRKDNFERLQAKVNGIEGERDAFVNKTLPERRGQIADAVKLYKLWIQVIQSGNAVIEKDLKLLAEKNRERMNWPLQIEKPAAAAEVVKEVGPQAGENAADNSQAAAEKSVEGSPEANREAVEV